MTRREEVRQWIIGVDQFASKGRAGQEKGWAKFVKKTLEQLDKMSDDEVVKHWGTEPFRTVGMTSDGDVEVIGENMFDPQSLADLKSLIQENRPQ